MHDDVGVHLGDLHRSDGHSLDFSAGPVGPPGASRASVHTDVVELAVLFDHFDAGVADICYGHFDCVAKVLRPLEAHNPCGQTENGGLRTILDFFFSFVHCDVRNKNLLGNKPDPDSDVVKLKTYLY